MAKKLTQEDLLQAEVKIEIGNPDGVTASEASKKPLYGAKTLLIRLEKAFENGAPRDKFPTPEQLGPRIPFKVGPTFGDEDDPRYEDKFKEALVFVHERFYRQFVSGTPRMLFTQAHNLRAIGIDLPPELADFEYIDKSEPAPSYYSDEDAYSHLWQLRDREMETGE